MSCILLVVPKTSVHGIAEALRNKFGLTVVTTHSRRAGLAALRRQSFSVVLLDCEMYSGDSVHAEILFQNAGLTPIIELNIAQLTTAQIVRQIRFAILRRKSEQANAHAIVRQEIRKHLRDVLSGLLLESEFALEHAAPDQQPNLRRILTAALEIRGCLQDP